MCSPYRSNVKSCQPPSHYVPPTSGATSTPFNRENAVHQNKDIALEFKKYYHSLLSQEEIDERRDIYQNKTNNLLGFKPIRK